MNRTMSDSEVIEVIVCQQIINANIDVNGNKMSMEEAKVLFHTYESTWMTMAMNGFSMNAQDMHDFEMGMNIAVAIDEVDSI